MWKISANNRTRGGPRSHTSGISVKLDNRWNQQRDKKKIRLQQDSPKRPLVVIVEITLRMLLALLQESWESTTYRWRRNPTKLWRMCWYIVYIRWSERQTGQTECVYKIPGANCDKSWKKVWSQVTRTHDRSWGKLHGRLQELTCVHYPAYQNTTFKSALTDHAAQENHNHNQLMVQRYGDRQGAGMLFQVDQNQKGSIHIRKEGQHDTLWIGTRAAPTTAFLTRHLPVVSRTGRTCFFGLGKWYLRVSSGKLCCVLLASPWSRKS